MQSFQTNSQTSSSKIGIAIVGTGFGQKVHLPGFKECSQTEVVAIHHRDLAKATSLAQFHQIPHACSTIQEIVSIPEVQAVAISTPPFLHDEMAQIVLKAGKHLLLEKPTTLTAQEARNLYHLAQQNRVVTTMDFEFRFVPAWQRFFELLQDDFVGQKRLIKIDWLVSSRADASRPWNWYAQKEKGGGVLGAVGSHAFDYIDWLFGKIQRLSARLYTSIPQRPDPETGELKLVNADDTGLIWLELADGTPCQICISSVTHQGRGHWIEVYGDRGTLVLGSDNQKDYVHGFRLFAAPTGKSLTEVEIPNHLAFPRNFVDGRIAPFIRVVENWVEAIQTGNPVIPSLKEGVYSQLLMDLSHQSHQQGTWVDVPEFEKFLKA